MLAVEHRRIIRLWPTVWVWPHFCHLLTVWPKVSHLVLWASVSFCMSLLNRLSWWFTDKTCNVPGILVVSQYMVVLVMSNHSASFPLPSVTYFRVFTALSSAGFQVTLRFGTWLSLSWVTPSWQCPTVILEEWTLAPPGPGPFLSSCVSLGCAPTHHI